MGFLLENINQSHEMRSIARIITLFAFNFYSFSPIITISLFFHRLIDKKHGTNLHDQNSWNSCSILHFLEILFLDRVEKQSLTLNETINRSSITIDPFP